MARKKKSQEKQDEAKFQAKKKEASRLIEKARRDLLHFKDNFEVDIRKAAGNVRDFRNEFETAKYAF